MSGGRFDYVWLPARAMHHHVRVQWALSTRGESNEIKKIPTRRELPLFSTMTDQLQSRLRTEYLNTTGKGGNVGQVAH